MENEQTGPGAEVDLGVLVEDTERLYNDSATHGIRARDWDYTKPDLADLAGVVAAWSRIPALLAGIAALRTRCERLQARLDGWHDGQWEIENKALRARVEELEAQSDNKWVVGKEGYTWDGETLRIKSEYGVRAFRPLALVVAVEELREGIQAQKERIEQLEADLRDCDNTVDRWTRRTNELEAVARAAQEVASSAHLVDTPWGRYAHVGRGAIEALQRTLQQPTAQEQGQTIDAVDWNLFDAHYNNEGREDKPGAPQPE